MSLNLEVVRKNHAHSQQVLSDPGVIAAAALIGGLLAMEFPKADLPNALVGCLRQHYGAGNVAHTQDPVTYYWFWDSAQSKWVRYCVEGNSYEVRDGATDPLQIRLALEATV